MNNDLIRGIFRKVLLWSIPVLILIIFLTKDIKAGILGYIFGVLISSLNFLLLKKSVEKSVRLSPSNASRYATGQYFIRMLIFFVALTIGAIADYLNFLGVVVGVLMIKAVILISNIIDSIYGRKRIKKRGGER